MGKIEHYKVKMGHSLSKTGVDWNGGQQSFRYCRFHLWLQDLLCDESVSDSHKQTACEKRPPPIEINELYLKGKKCSGWDRCRKFYY